MMIDHVAETHRNFKKIVFAQDWIISKLSTLSVTFRYASKRNNPRMYCPYLLSPEDKSVVMTTTQELENDGRKWSTRLEQYGLNLLLVSLSAKGKSLIPHLLA